MLTRRGFAFGSVAGGVVLAAPAVLRAEARVAAARDAALGFGQLHAIIVQRGEEQVLAEAPRGPGLDRVANIKSCSKSVLALLLGSALERGELPAVAATLAEVAPGLIPDDATPGVAELTLEHLVTLRAGLEGTSGAEYGAWVGSRDWVAHALRRPRIAPNGGPMIYSTGTTHVLGAALAVAAGRSLLDLARERLGGPLGIEVPGWTRDPQGYYFGGNDMVLTPEAMLRVGLVMRDGGRFGGAQVIGADWVAASRVMRTRSPFSGLGYGYGWFLTESGWCLARGYGGQVIAAHAGRGLAVAITSDPTRPARSEGYFGDLMRLLEGPVLALA